MAFLLDTPPATNTLAKGKPPVKVKESETVDYLKRNVTVTDVEQVNFKDFLDRQQHGVNGVIKNNGNRTITSLVITTYFYDRDNQTCGEYSCNLIGVFKEPLKPNYTMKLDVDLTDHIPPGWSGRITYTLSDCKLDARQ